MSFGASLASAASHLPVVSQTEQKLRDSPHSRINQLKAMEPATINGGQKLEAVAELMKQMREAFAGVDSPLRKRS